MERDGDEGGSDGDGGVLGWGCGWRRAGGGHWKVGEGSGRGGPRTVPSLIHDGDRWRGDESRAGRVA